MRSKCKKLKLDDIEVIWCTCIHDKSYIAENRTGGGKTWWLCDCCGLPSKWTLNQCDTCDKLFKGPYPIKIAFTCPECEESLL